jgi:hypothetical protein
MLPLSEGITDRLKGVERYSDRWSYLDDVGCQTSTDWLAYLGSLSES